jgi:hypothetical protein
MVYKFTVNLLNLNSLPIQYKYIIDNCGGLFSFQTITDNTDIIEYYDPDSSNESGDKIIIERFKNNIVDDEYQIKKDNYNGLLEKLNNRCEYGKMPFNFKFELDIFNKEYVFTAEEHVYKFIINCGLTGSKQVDNIAVVVESGASTHDISKIILKQDGAVEIVRTNNNNQLIVKSATRNRFEGNVGYKFAISGGIPLKTTSLDGDVVFKANNKKLLPCVVSLDIPDDAEVVFDHYHNKFRCNKCVVKDIQPILDRKVKEIENTCSVCMIDRPNVMFDPCQHVACDACVASITTKDNECYECKNKINSYITLNKNVVTDKMNMGSAKSAIYCSDFEYKIGETIIIDDFDITQYWKCSAGIHFHNKIEDVYNWLEFIEIPETEGEISVSHILPPDELKDIDDNMDVDIESV